MEFNVSLDLKERTDNGLEGTIIQTSMPSIRPTPTLVRGNVFNGMISLNFYVSDRISANCLFEPTQILGGVVMEARGASSVLNFQSVNKTISIGRIHLKRAKIVQ